MKILFLTDQFHLHGGVEKVLSQKLNYLAENHNHKVYLVTIENKNNTFLEWVKNDYDPAKLKLSFKVKKLSEILSTYILRRE